MSPTIARSPLQGDEVEPNGQPTNASDSQGHRDHERLSESAESREAADSLDSPDGLMQAKQEAEPSATEVSQHTSIYPSNDSREPTGRPWNTSLLRFGPLAGIFCILLAISSILVSIAILMGSRNAPVANWTVPPSSYLAICTAVANQALRFAAFQGVVIAWWYRAMRTDSTLRDYTPTGILEQLYSALSPPVAIWAFSALPVSFRR